MEKNYIKGFAKEKTFDNWWSILSLSLNIEQLNKLPVDKYGNIKIDICKKKEVDKFNNTHYVVENTFMPKENKKEEDIPF